MKIIDAISLWNNSEWHFIAHIMTTISDSCTDVNIA